MAKSIGDRFAINMNQLHLELVEQPKMFHEASIKLADAKYELATAEAELELIEATYEMDIRKDPERFDLKKVTDDSVKACLRSLSVYTDAVEKINKAKYLVDLCNGDVRTLDHRKSAVEELVSLRLADYFADPKPRGEGSREFAEDAVKRAGHEAAPPVRRVPKGK